MARPDQPNDQLAGTRGDSTLVVGAMADRRSQTFASVCTVGSGPGQSEGTVTLGECEGKLSQTQGGQQTYVFDCTTKPTPGLGWNVSRYFIKGYVRVR